MDKRKQFNIWYVVIALLAYSLLQSWLQNQSFQEIPYSQFEQELARNNIERVQVTDDRVFGEYKSVDENGNLKFTANRIPQDLAAQLSSHEVEYGGVIEKPSLLGTLASWVMPALVFIGLWMLIIKRFAGKLGGMGGMMNVGKSKARVMVEEDTGVTFDDVAGVDEAKAELVEVVEFLKNPQHYGRLGATVPKGILLVGPPGTGKTLMAKAVAGQAGVPFFSISGSEFVEMFVGVGAARVRDLFEEAQKKSPAIIFIDELDALGGARGASPTGGHNEREQTLNQLLVELDGFDANSGIVLLAATNRPEILDPALLRAGRFDRQVLVDRPDKTGRIAILGIHMQKIRRGDDVNAEQIAALTPGFTGADLANLVNEAALLATRRGGDSVTMDDFNNAVERIVAGLEKRNRLLNPVEREIVAYHEMGHALVAMALPGTDKVHKVSIIPRGIGALGYTIQRPTEDRFLMSRDELKNKIAVLLAGRAAEKLMFSHLSTGASDDISRATDIARNMVTRYGMDAELGSVAYETTSGPNHLGTQQTQKEYSEKTAQEIDDSVRDIISEDGERAYRILQDNRAVLESTAKTLLEKETLDEADLINLTTDLKIQA
ncbi:MAG: ATP-dependent zinc metalloprotease FtsH [Gammaproteobacteria bacterium]|nr:ATP-dependent zinc metalloprotease FtsH [Gammaproteobacteria bacterium]